MSDVKSLRTLILDLPPSCIEFWPTDPHYAVVGTYNLEKNDTDEAGVDSAEPSDDNVQSKTTAESQQRNGSLIVIRVEGDDVEIIQTLPTPSAILDIHFHPTSPVILGAATSTGTLDIYDFSPPADTSPEPKLTFQYTIDICSSDILVTAFSWHTAGNSYGASLSNSEIHVGHFDISTAEKSRSPSLCIGNHDLEAWTLSFLRDGRGILSGGDDSALKFWGLPDGYENLIGKPERIDGEGRVEWSDGRSHGAGVTAILPLASDQGDLVLTGSYDDHIRLLHTPRIGRRAIVAELILGGGVWRLKLLPQKTDHGATEGKAPREVLILASCMHAGARILRLQQNEAGTWAFEVLARFEEHESMNYGSDCQPDVDDKGQRAYISTSFYDRRLCLWRV